MTGFNWLLEMLGADRYSAHAICLSNDPIVMMLFAASNLVTCAAYVTIAYALLSSRITSFYASKSGKKLFAWFIGLCGLHHGCQVLTLFAGVYRLELWVDMAMAAVSAMTAIMAIKKSFPLSA